MGGKRPVDRNVRKLSDLRGQSPSGDVPTKDHQSKSKRENIEPAGPRDQERSIDCWIEKPVEGKLYSHPFRHPVHPQPIELKQQVRKNQRTEREKSRAVVLLPQVNGASPVRLR